MARWAIVALGPLGIATAPLPTALGVRSTPSRELSDTS